MSCNGNGIHERNDGSWWENDARGIPLARVCASCMRAKLARFRPEVLADANYETNEDIEPEPSCAPELDLVNTRAGFGAGEDW